MLANELQVCACVHVRALVCVCLCVCACVRAFCTSAHDMMIRSLLRHDSWNESCLTCQRFCDMTHGMSHVLHVNESCLTCQRVMSYMSTSHGP